MEKLLMIFSIFLISLTPQIFAESVSSDVGTLTIDESGIEISSGTEYSLKIHGMINSIQYDNKGHIQITLPDGTTDGGLFVPTNDSYFELFYDINYESQLGDYKILGTYGNQIIGTLSFSVSEKQFTLDEIKETRDEKSKEDAIIEAKELAAAEAEAAVKEAKELAAAEAEAAVKEAKELAAAEAREQTEYALIQQEKEKSMEPFNTLAKISIVILTIIILIVVWKGKKMNDDHADENLLVDIAKD